MKISFVIPTFNSVTWLPHAVTSCLQQTHKDVEVVIVDDGSTDRTGEYLDWLAKNSKNVLIHRGGVNRGRSAARNLGNRSAQGDVICVLDADDLATPNRAEITARKFKAGGVDYVYGGATAIDVLGRPSHNLSADVFDLEQALKTLQNRIVHSTAAYTRDFAKRFPYHEGEIARLGIDDWAQQIEARLSGARFDFVPQRLAAYRLLSSQVTKTRDEQAVAAAKKAFLEQIKAPAEVAA